MKTEMLEKLDGYEDIVQDINTSRELGSDFQELKGEVSRFIHSLHPKQVHLRIADIIQETKSTKTIRFIPESGRLPPFLAGQYISLLIEIDNIRTSRPYSISSSPTDTDHWDLTVRLVENGLVSNYLLDEVNIGDCLVSTGPQGNFYFNPLIHKKDSVFLAGGSGITPFISMIKDAVNKRLDRKIHLIYGVTNIEEAISHEILKELTKRYDTIEYTLVVEHPPAGFRGYKGFIGADVITDSVGSLDDKSVFICGPQGMYDFCQEQLALLKYPKNRVRKEMYGMSANIWQSPGWPSEIDKNKKVTVHCNGEKVGDCKASESLLSVLERNHKPVQAICRSGECSMCRVKLLKGKVFQPQGIMVRKSDRKFGFIHACASYPLSDVEILT